MTQPSTASPACLIRHHVRHADGSSLNLDDTWVRVCVYRVVYKRRRRARVAVVVTLLCRARPLLSCHVLLGYGAVLFRC